VYILIRGAGCTLPPPPTNDITAKTPDRNTLGPTAVVERRHEPEGDVGLPGLPAALHQHRVICEFGQERRVDGRSEGMADAVGSQVVHGVGHVTGSAQLPGVWA
jgi:hypothetical protein